jgi:two-component system KDP operon response regulator KdpE
MSIVSEPTDTRVSSRDGTPLRLTPREYDLLAVLARNAGRVVTHAKYFPLCGARAHRDDSQYLRVFIGQLRAKIERDPSAPSLVKTEPGVGYRFSEPDSVDS